jgi:predicted MFS family arabinose efflux permease
VLALTLAVFGAGNLLAAALPSYPVILAVRVVEGAALPVFLSVGSAAIAAAVGPARRGRALAQLNIGVVVGVVLAIPAGAALAAGAGWATAFAVLGILALAMAATLGLAFRVDVAPAPVGGQVALLGEPVLLAHLALSATVFTAMFASYTYLTSFLEEVAGLRGDRLALALMGFGLAGLVGNELAGRLVARGATAVTVGAMLVLGTVTAAVTLLQQRWTALLPLLVLWGAAHTSCFVLCQVRVMRAGSSAPAFAASLNIAACNLGIALGAVLGGAVVERAGVTAVGLATSALSLVPVCIGVWLQRYEARPPAGLARAAEQQAKINPLMARLRALQSRSAPAPR